MQRPVKSSDGNQKRDASCEVSSIHHVINQIITQSIEIILIYADYGRVEAGWRFINFQHE
jgi:predicted component of type VI protein secretion system